MPKIVEVPVDTEEMKEENFGSKEENDNLGGCEDEEKKEPRGSKEGEIDDDKEKREKELGNKEKEE